MPIITISDLPPEKSPTTVSGPLYITYSKYILITYTCNAVKSGLKFISRLWDKIPPLL